MTHISGAVGTREDMAAIAVKAVKFPAHLVDHRPHLLPSTAYSEVRREESQLDLTTDL